MAASFIEAAGSAGRGPAHPGYLRHTKVTLQAGPGYYPLIVPSGSIWASTRIARLLRSITLPCGLTFPVHLSLAGEWTAPFVIVDVSGMCSRRQRSPRALLFDASADTPAYVPSNAVGGGPGEMQMPQRPKEFSPDQTWFLPASVLMYPTFPRLRDGPAPSSRLWMSTARSTSAIDGG